MGDRDREQPLSILQVNTVDLGGGAEKVARNLFEAYRSRGHESWLAVGSKQGDDPDVFVIPNQADRNGWARGLRSASDKLRTQNGQGRGYQWLGRGVGWMAEPRRSLEHALGVEDFNFPGSRNILRLTPEPPDIIHCHNLHGGYFDLRFLSELSYRVPVILTLHDAWLLSGHCAHAFDCPRWQKGCGMCPDLATYPGVRRDATGFNWRRKSNIYARSRLYVSTPCEWLMKRVENSMLRPIESRIVPYGVDLNVFCAADRGVARSRLGLAEDALVLLFISPGARTNPWKDYDTLERAVGIIAAQNTGRQVVFLCVGATEELGQIGGAEVRFLPFRKDPKDVADFYKSADVYIHAAKVDTFPNVILEALACGTPVVATAVGGIPEQIEDGKTGFLVAPGDAVEMAARVSQVLANQDLRLTLSVQAAESARRRFDLQRQVDAYLDWYRETLMEREGNHSKSDKGRGLHGAHHRKARPQNLLGKPSVDGF